MFLEPLGSFSVREIVIRAGWSRSIRRIDSESVAGGRWLKSAIRAHPTTWARCVPNWPYAYPSILSHHRPQPGEIGPSVAARRLNMPPKAVIRGSAACSCRGPSACRAVVPGAGTRPRWSMRWPHTWRGLPPVSRALRAMLQCRAQFRQKTRSIPTRSPDSFGFASLDEPLCVGRRASAPGHRQQERLPNARLRSGSGDPSPGAERDHARKIRRRK